MVDLYDDMIPSETVKQMADDLESVTFIPEYIAHYDIEKDEFEILLEKGIFLKAPLGFICLN